MNKHANNTYTSRIGNDEITPDQMLNFLQQCRRAHDLEIADTFSSMYSRFTQFFTKARFMQHKPA